jgi:hypothetical protein
LHENAFDKPDLKEQQIWKSLFYTIIIMKTDSFLDFCMCH